MPIDSSKQRSLPLRRCVTTLAPHPSNPPSLPRTPPTPQHPSSNPTHAPRGRPRRAGYPGSHVLRAGLPTVQALQRRSFGHRNLRTYVVVVADARSAPCVAVEAQLEQLASGLGHEAGVAVMALDAGQPAAAAFAARILNVGSLPAVLVYPEAAPGFLAYRGALGLGLLAGLGLKGGPLGEGMGRKGLLCSEGVGAEMGSVGGPGGSVGPPPPPP